MLNSIEVEDNQAKTDGNEELEPSTQLVQQNIVVNEQELIDDTFNAQNIRHLEEEAKQEHKGGNMFVLQNRNSGDKDDNLLVNSDDIRMDGKASEGDNSSNKFPPISRQSANFN